MPFAGAVVQLQAPSPLPALRLAVSDGGTLLPASEGATPILTLTLMPAALPALLKGQENLMRAVRVEGNEKLADAILFLVRHLRWDVEEDLSRVVGDTAARRIASGARTLAAWQLEAARRALEGLMEYAGEEGRVLVPRAESDELGRRTARLRDALERLEQRLSLLENRA